MTQVVVDFHKARLLLLELQKHTDRQKRGGCRMTHSSRLSDRVGVIIGETWLIIHRDVFKCEISLVVCRHLQV